VWLRPDDDTKPLQIINTVQAHSQPVNLLRITHDSKCLFSVGLDNMLCFFEVRDMSKNAKLESDLRFSN